MQLTRRQALAAAGVAAATACTTDKPAPRATPSLVDALRAEAVDRERALVELYEQALHLHPGLTSVLAPLLGDHAAHLQALLPAAGPSPSPFGGFVEHGPADEAFSRHALAAHERAAAKAHAEAAARAGADCDADSLTLLLASLAACEASHAALL